MTNRRPYREELFQWIWQQLEFDCNNLRTSCGKSLQIIDAGSLNHGAGPDFLGAHLRIDKKEWFGSVEIHKNQREWIQHGHHKDEEFNSVILHVIFEEDDSKRIQTKDGHEPFTFVLKPRLEKKIHRLLEAKQKSGIACSGNVSFINQKAFEEQIAKAQKEYLEYKVEELLEFYDPSLPLSTAWINCLIIGMYRTLGIPSNKNQMAELAQVVVEECIPDQEIPNFEKQIEQLAFKSEKNFHWIFSGMRPASRPQQRVKQAAFLHYSILQLPFKQFFKNELDKTWNEILHNIRPADRPGQSRLSLIKQIVYLPALYLLADLLQANKLKQSALEAWSSSSQHVPGEIKGPFKKAGFAIHSSTKKIGLAHQYKRYCLEKNCHRCEVFKKAIRS
jgi:hypothetical protein